MGSDEHEDSRASRREDGCCKRNIRQSIPTKRERNTSRNLNESERDPSRGRFAHQKREIRCNRDLGKCKEEVRRDSKRLRKVTGRGNKKDTIRGTTGDN